MKVLFLITFLFGQFAYAACIPGDQVISQITNTEQMACTGHGHCYGWGVNPENGQYESFYGFHSDCPGQQSRDVTQYTCRNSSGGIYAASDEGFWGFCQVH